MRHNPLNAVGGRTRPRCGRRVKPAPRTRLRLPKMASFDEVGVFLRYRFKRPGAFVDVGANYGLFVAPFARRGTDVVAFEPHPDLFAFLEREYANQPHVRIVQRAIADQPGRLAFYTSTVHPGIHSLAAFHPTHELQAEVAVNSLDDELSRINVTSVAALKVDTEGADLLVLRGFDFAKRQPELVMVEFMDNRSLEHFGYTHHDMASLMADQGYETWVSEWAAIEEYGRAGEAHSHTWLGFSSYRPCGTPACGNLIFVRPEDRPRLHSAVTATLRRGRARDAVRALPGARTAASIARGGITLARSHGSRRVR